MSGRLGLYWMLAGRVLGWIAGFGAILIAARVLGTHSFGAFSIVMAVWGLVYEGIELGYPRLLIRDIALQPEPGPYLGTVLFLTHVLADYQWAHNYD